MKTALLLAIILSTGLASAQETNVAPKSALVDSMGTTAAPSSTQAAPAPPAAAAQDNAQLAHDVGKLCDAHQYDAALAKLDPTVQADPKNLYALSLRGYVHCKLKQWGPAQIDFQSILQVNPQSIDAKFDLAEVQFLQKDYTGARTAFNALTPDANIGDLAAYKVFLCDLYGGDMRKARAELEAFDLVASNPSYYFANVAWELYHKRPDSARPWLASAAHIYYPAKLENYSRSLIDLGYLPLPAPGDAAAAPPKTN